MNLSTRIGIADYNEFARASLNFIVRLEPSLRVVAEAENGSEAVAMVKKHRPDVVLIGTRLPDMNGIDATRIIISRFPNTKVIVLNTHTDQNYRDCAIAAGASDFLIRGCHIDEILTAIHECSTVARVHRESCPFQNT
jgi:two-component system, NarL family, response regulator DegU